MKFGPVNGVRHKIHLEELALNQMRKWLTLIPSCHYCARGNMSSGHVLFYLTEFIVCHLVFTVRGIPYILIFIDINSHCCEI